jgi:hypothetical protein
MMPSQMRSITFAFLLLLVGSATLYSQTASQPENGFVSRGKYTNAYFGFSLPLPQNAELQLLAGRGSKYPLRHVLFAANGSHEGHPALTVMADEIKASGQSTPEALLASFGAHKVNDLSIGGKKFFRGDWKSDDIFFVTYATELNGYLLHVTAVSFNKKVLNEFERSIQAMTFFDPATAQTNAGPDSRPYNGPP